MPESPNIEALIESIAALPLIERRPAFFAALATLPAYSMERRDFMELARGRFAPGPYVEAEFNLLHPGVVARGREKSPEEQAVLDRHAELYAARLECHARYSRALEELEKATHKRGSLLITSPDYEAARTAALDALEDLKLASEQERLARPHLHRPETLRAPDRRGRIPILRNFFR